MDASLGIASVKELSCTAAVVTQPGRWNDIVWGKWWPVVLVPGRADYRPRFDSFDGTSAGNISVPDQLLTPRLLLGRLHVQPIYTPNEDDNSREALPLSNGTLPQRRGKIPPPHPNAPPRPQGHGGRPRCDKSWPRASRGIEWRAEFGAQATQETVRRKKDRGRSSSSKINARPERKY